MGSFQFSSPADSISSMLEETKVKVVLIVMYINKSFIWNKMFVTVCQVRVRNLLIFEAVYMWLSVRDCEYGAVADGAVAEGRLNDAFQQEEQLVGCNRLRAELVDGGKTGFWYDSFAMKIVIKPK